MRDRITLSQFPAAGALLRDYAQSAQWDEPIAQWFHYNPHDALCFAQRIEELNSRGLSAQHTERVATIITQQSSWGNDGAAISAARSMADAVTFTVVTGQQAGLLGGPLYSQLKAISAIKLARQLKQQHPQYNFVPVFWVASGDSDFDEVRRTYVLNRSGEVSELALPPQPADDNAIIAAREVDFSAVLAQLADELPGGIDREKMLAEIGAAYDGQHMHSAFARWMARLFRGTGLVIVDPSAPELRAAAREFAAAELADPAATTAALAQRNAEITAAGYAPQVELAPGDTNVFVLRDGQRYKVAQRDDGELTLKQSGEVLDLALSVHDYSVGALLNPLYQDALLRPVAFLGGGAELAYRAQSSALADLHGIKLAPAFLRATATLLPEKDAALLDELGWELPQLWRPRDEVLKDAVALDKPEDVRRALEQYFATIQSADAELRAAAIALDPTLEESFETLRGNLIRHLDKLDKKLNASLKQRGDARVNRIGRICNEAFPRGGVQERELSLLTFLPRYGFELVETLMEQLEVPCWEHLIVVL